MGPEKNTNYQDNLILDLATEKDSTKFPTMLQDLLTPIMDGDNESQDLLNSIQYLLDINPSLRAFFENSDNNIVENI